MTAENDIVLVYMEDEPLFFARIEQISADVKKDWFQMEMLILQIPLQTITWILRDKYINGEPFTMEGKQVRLEKVRRQIGARGKPAAEELPAEPGKQSSKVISFSDLKKK